MGENGNKDVKQGVRIQTNLDVEMSRILVHLDQGKSIIVFQENGKIFSEGWFGERSFTWRGSCEDLKSLLQKDAENKGIKM